MLIFDSHFHIIDPQFPLIPNNGFVPDPFTVEQYLSVTAGLGFSGGALVSGSFQGFDSAFLKKALIALGSNFIGVVNMKSVTDETEITQLHDAGVRAVRFNIRREDSDTLKNMVQLAARVYEQCGWHAEIYANGQQLASIRAALKRMKRFSIDHLGVSQDGISELYYHAERGARIKASGFGRLTFDPIPVMRKLHEINPACMMFGTDLPGTRVPVPFSKKDIDLITENFDEMACTKILYQNAADWYFMPREG